MYVDTILNDSLITTVSAKYREEQLVEFEDYCRQDETPIEVTRKFDTMLKLSDLAIDQINAEQIAWLKPD